MHLIINNLPRAIDAGKEIGFFDRPYGDAIKNRIRDEGYNGPASATLGCLRWIWSQWLAGGPAEEIQSQVGKFVDRALETQSLTTRLEWRGRHDLFLLHCAIYGSSDVQLKTLAEKVVDATGLGNQKPEERDGELYASAYSGMLKYWILGDLDKAAAQSEVIWKAYQDNSFRCAAKTLVTPWLKQDWKSFAKNQQKDFDRLWGRIRKEREVMTENGDEVVIASLLKLSVPQFWCWGHCGLALLANRRFGVDVVTDPLFFPPHALKATPTP